MNTADLAHAAANLPAADIPPDAQEAARLAVADTLGVAVAGASGDAAGIAAHYALSLEAAPVAPLWGRAAATAPAEAAFVNAVSGHVLDFDDSLPSLTGHPSNGLCAAGLAQAAARSAQGDPVDGGEFLAAFVIGVEVAGKLGRALGHGHYRTGWHPTATVGAFAAAAMVGRLMRLDAGRMASALALAAAQSAGLVRNFGTMAKPFQAGHAARAGYMAARLAGLGMTGAADILDGNRGFLAAYGDADSLTEVPPVGAPWDILDPGLFVKRWPCCYGNHRGLAGIFELMQRHALRPDEIAGIEVGFLPEADKALIHRSASTGLEGKFSIEYCAAVAVMDGAVGLDSFRDDAVRRPAVQAMMGKVARVAMPGKGSYSGVHGYTDVTIRTTRGAFSTRVEHTPGSPGAPMTAADRQAKFFDCATPALGADPAGALWQALGTLPRMPDVARLGSLMAQDPAARAEAS